MSLLCLHLENFVIVEQLAIDFSTGFSVLTGETGAGKSILIDALQLVLGAKADATVIREGATKTVLCAEFAPSASAQQWLLAQDLSTDDASIALRRVVDRQGKSKAWINGTPCSASQLKQLGGLLIDIHGQHAWQSLTKAETTRQLLDEYGAIDTQPIKTAWQQWQHVLKACHTAQAQQAASQDRREQLEHWLTEVEQLSPKADEWSALQNDQSRLAHMQSLLDTAQTAHDGLSSGSPPMLSHLHKMAATLLQKSHLEPQFKAIAAQIEQAHVLAQEAERDLHQYLRHTQAEPEALEQLEQRMSQWLRMAKRHHVVPEELPTLHTQWRQELQQLDQWLDPNGLEQQANALEKAYRAQAQCVSAARSQAALALQTRITAFMQQLGMQGGQFQVVLHALEQAQAHGTESVEFWVAGHAGASTGPIGKVASGGELSRIALAIAVATSQLGQCPTLIFDEVDSGIGGLVANTVGQLMRDLGEHRQVLAVTHLPQVACCAHQHLMVRKSVHNEQVISQVQHLDGQQRIFEIVRMLGGNPNEPASVAHAQHMLQT